MIYGDCGTTQNYDYYKKSWNKVKYSRNNNDIWWDAALQPYGENIT
jgi:hypothetical protein